MKQDNLVPNNDKPTPTLKIIFEVQLDNDCPRSIPLHEVVPAMTNHQKLSEALRKDMRLAAEFLLPIRDEISISPIASYFGWLEKIDAALAALDCIDHIPVLSDAGQVQYNLDELKAQKSVSDIQHTGIIEYIRKITTKKGEQMAIMTLDTGVDIVVFPRILQLLRDKLENSFTEKLTFDCQDYDNDRDEYYLNSIVGFERIENTIEALIDETDRIWDAIGFSDGEIMTDSLMMQYHDLLDETDRRKESDKAHAQDFGSAWMTDACVTCGQEHSTYLRNNGKYYCSMCWTVWNS